jgi:hypothetical protein
VPALVLFQIRDGPHAGEPISERGEVERLARKCQAAECRAGLDATVVETRVNVVRSGVPHIVATARRLRNYLPPDSAGALWPVLPFDGAAPACDRPASPHTVAAVAGYPTARSGPGRNRCR